MPGKDDNTLNNFGLYKDTESILKEQDIVNDHKDLISENLDTRTHIKNKLSGYTPQDELFRSESSLFLRKLGLIKKNFPLVHLYIISNIITKDYKIIIFFILFMIS